MMTARTLDRRPLREVAETGLKIEPIKCDHCSSSNSPSLTIISSYMSKRIISRCLINAERVQRMIGHPNIEFLTVNSSFSTLQLHKNRSGSLYLNDCLDSHLVIVRCSLRPLFALRPPLSCIITT